jgi:adenylate cyclase
VATLHYKDATGTPRRFALKDRVNIGRHPAQDIQLLDRVVSKEHAVIERLNGSFRVFDNGSRNGTLINGRPLDEPCELADGDCITIGSTTIVFDASTAPNLVNRVTVQNSIESAIRTRVSSDSALGFLPEHAVHDVDALRRDYEKLRIANELNQALALEFDLDRLLRKVLDRAFAIFRCDRGVILIRDEKSGEFVPRAAHHRSKRDAAEEIRISETILKEVVEKHQAILSSDAQVDSRFNQSHSIIMAGIRSTMSVPLLYADRLLGVIHLDSQVATGAFSDKDLQLLSGFARQAAASIEHANLVKRIRNEALSREKFDRLLPPALVDQVMRGNIDIRKGGDLRRATLLFADIRGFTSMAERLPPQELVTILNEYFEVMVDIIFKRGGTLDKFIGDAIMAIWGAPFSRPDDSFQAVAAALEMQTALAEFNETRKEEGLSPLHIGIGMNTGEVVAGYMGSSRAMSYTAVGDVVNVASRLCNIAGPGEVVVTRDTLEAVGSGIHAVALPPAKLKGKTLHVEAFRVRELEGVGAPRQINPGPS